VGSQSLRRNSLISSRGILLPSMFMRQRTLLLPSDPSRPLASESYPLSRKEKADDSYDYVFDYVFYLDGSIETIVRASGYIQSAFYANNSDYGYQIHDALSGSMHDHSLQFKVDLDIAGVNNTMVKHKFIPVDVNYKWSNVTRSTMKLSRSEVSNEDESRMVCPPTLM
jgi:Cu2+-containing amine oxidase